MRDTYDVVVIGAGPAGYVAAIRCAQLGLRTACVDRWTNPAGKAALGGTCLNVGCIPSKALLDSSEKFHELTHSYKQHGISVENPKMDISTMMQRKAKIVATLTGGIAALFKANQVDAIHAHGRLVNSGTVELLDVESEEKQGELSASHVILASGSVPIELQNIPFDGDRIVDSTGALAFAQVPERLGVVGAGVIGLELGSVWNRLGSKVIVLEALPDFLSTADVEVAREAAKQFKQQGLEIRLGARVDSAAASATCVVVNYTVDGESDQIEVDRLIICIGRKPCTVNLFDQSSGVEIDDRGFVRVDENCLTGAVNTYAIGDCVRGPMLAHKGSEEGIAVAERIATGTGHMNYATVPWAIYTHPEIAWVGSTEQEAKTDGIDYRIGKFPFAATGRAKAMADTVGFVKLIAHAETDRILGVHIIGPHASELIAEVVVAMEYCASSEDLARIIHAHPTLSEAVHEAALSVDQRAIHRVN